MKTHDLKCWPEFFRHLLSGEKTFEIRKDDRGYRAGDMLDLREWDMVHGYSGRRLLFEVTYIASGIMLAPDHVVMALRPATTGPGPRGAS